LLPRPVTSPRQTALCCTERSSVENASMTGMGENAQARIWVSTHCLALRHLGPAKFAYVAKGQVRDCIWFAAAVIRYKVRRFKLEYPNVPASYGRLAECHRRAITLGVRCQCFRITRSLPEFVVLVVTTQGGHQFRSPPSPSKDIRRLRSPNTTQLTRESPRQLIARGRP